jgi:malonate-semialdehyde dehydrogenase (acetylating)/methylmalonate-semialdehyde dehydrogenase
MVPLWMIPQAIVGGNAFVLKPSERVPLASLRLAQLFEEAGLPKGVFNIVQGGREVVEALCDHPKIKAVGFVGLDEGREARVRAGRPRASGRSASAARRTTSSWCPTPTST